MSAENSPNLASVGQQAMPGSGKVLRHLCTVRICRFAKDRGLGPCTYLQHTDERVSIDGLDDL